MKGKIALVDRGFCAFTQKVLNAQNAGAKAVIVANNSASATFAMGGTDGRIRIPAVMISQADGAILKANLAGLTGTVKAHPNPPLILDASLDADIGFHEHGHGLTWRMIGGMDGPMPGAIREGARGGGARLGNGDGRKGDDAA